MEKMTLKDMEREPHQIGHSSQKREEGDTDHWVYTTIQGHDIDVTVALEGYDHYTITTPWYRAQVRTYDLLDTVVQFCNALYGSGTLTILVS